MDSCQYETGTPEPVRLRARASPRGRRAGVRDNRQSRRRALQTYRRALGGFIRKSGEMMDLLNTISGSLMEGFFPAGWDLKKIDDCVDSDPRSITKRQKWWHRGFEPVACATYADFDTMMGHEIALTIRRSRDAGEKLALILPVGPMGMYRWTVYFLTEWGVPCDHVFGFNMDEWSDAKGNTLPSDNSGAFQHAMEQAFYGPLGAATVPRSQRHFALKAELP